MERGTNVLPVGIYRSDCRAITRAEQLCTSVYSEPLVEVDKGGAAIVEFLCLPELFASERLDGLEQVIAGDLAIERRRHQRPVDKFHDGIGDVPFREIATGGQRLRVIEGERCHENAEPTQHCLIAFVKQIVRPAHGRIECAMTNWRQTIP